MAWCKLEDTYHDDPKWDELGTRLSVPAMHAAGCVAAMWSWALRHAPDGFLGKMSAKSISRASRWDGDENAFLQASLDSRTIDETDNGYEIHGFAKRSESNKRAQQKRRERRKSERSQTVARQSPDCRGNVAEERRREEKRGEEILDPTTTQKSLVRTERKTKTPPAPTADAVGYTEAVAAWFRNFEEFYGKKPVWGKLQGRQMKNIIPKARDIEELVALIEQFFHGPYQDSIDDGHSLSTGFKSFAMRIDMLRADLDNPQRRARASRIRGQLRQVEKAASGDTAKDEAAELSQALLALVARRGRTWSSTCRYDGHATAEDGVASELGDAAAEVVRRGGGWDAFCREWGSKQGDATSRAQLRGLCEAAQPLRSGPGSSRID